MVAKSPVQETFDRYLAALRVTREQFSSVHP